MSNRVRNRNKKANRGFARGGSLNTYERNAGIARGAGRIVGAVIAIVLVVLSAVALIFGIRTLLKSKENELPTNIKIRYSEDITVSYKRDEIYKNNVLYIDFDSVASILGLTKSRFGDEVSYFTLNGDSMIFTVSSDTVYVNKIPCPSVGAPFFGEDGQLMAASDLVNLYINDTSVTVSDDGKTVSLVTVITDVSEVSFNLKKSVGLEGMERPSSLPADTKYDPNGTLPPDDITTALPSDPQDAYIKDIIAAYEFKTDISKYKQYLDPVNASDFLILANRQSPLGKDHIPTSLTVIDKNDVLTGKTISLQKNAAMALEAMIAEMKADGAWDTLVCSAYRTYEYQENLYNYYISEEKKAHPDYTDAEIIALVDSYSARPGTSDHQTGLCVDFYDVEVTFKEKKAFAWLTENAHKFGFILRFPEGKTSITGYTYEPWHWRFVGQTAAYKIHTGDLTLEEFLVR